MKKLFIIAILLISCASNQLAGNVKEDLRNIYLSSVSLINKNREVYGSGTIIYSKPNQQLFILTAAHVVKGFQNNKENIYISTGFDTSIRIMEIYKIDHIKDLALIRSKKKEKLARPYVNISNNNQYIGDNIWVVGAPNGTERTLTYGIISNFQKLNGKLLYRTTADIYYGNSGGGMFDYKGELIGVAHGVLEVPRNMFSSQLVPGGNFFVGLEEIKKFL